MVFMYTNWNICTVVGLIAGRMLQDIGGWGLNFAMVAAFIGMVIPYLKDRPHVCAALAAGICALLFNGLPHKLGLIVASIVGILAGVAAERLQAKPARTTVQASGEH